MSQRDKPRQGVVASTLNLFRNGAIGFIDWLGRCHKDENCEGKTKLPKAEAQKRPLAKTRMRKVEHCRASQEPDPKRWSRAHQTTKRPKPRTQREEVLGRAKVAASVRWLTVARER